MKKILVVEDSLERMDRIESYFSGFKGYDWAKSASVAISLLKTNEYDFILLDHDLEEEHYKTQFFGKGTGIEVVDFIVANTIPLKGAVVHSLNPVGRESMMRTLKRHGYDVIGKPSFWDGRYGGLVLKFCEVI